MGIAGTRVYKFVLLSLVLTGFLHATIAGAAVDDLALPHRLEYVNVELRDIFRALAETGRFRVLFAHQFQKKATMIIHSGAFVKQTISEITANHGLVVKWLHPDTVVIGDRDSLAGIKTTDLTLHVLPLEFIPAVSAAKALETVVPGYKMQCDMTANTLAVMASSLELQNITEMMNKLDRDTPRIRMKIEIIEVNADFLRTLGLPATGPPQMKAYPLPPKVTALIRDHTGRNLLARQEVISLNNQGGRLLFGDQIPSVSEESKTEATSYQIGYIDVGTTIDYFVQLDYRPEIELLVQLQAKVNMMTDPSSAAGGPARPAVKREVDSTVGLVPGQTIMLTGALTRDEYLRMKTPLYEFPFLDSLFANARPGGPNAQTATLILITPDLTEKTAYTSQPDSQPESPREEPVTTLETTDIPYIVKIKDTLFGISRKFGVDRQAIIKANQIKTPGLIKAGTTLVIPVPNQFIYTVKPKETLWRLAKRYGTTVEVLQDLNSLDYTIDIKAGQKLVLPVPVANIAHPEF